MSNFKKLSAYVDVPCEWVSTTASNNDKLDQLKAENAKLREQYETVLADYRSEVAKLRELVRDMAECMDNSQPRCKKCKFRELNCQWFKFDDRMRELGVEVD